MVKDSMRMPRAATIKGATIRASQKFPLTWTRV
jgi:hypothetical protein